MITLVLTIHNKKEAHSNVYEIRNQNYNYNDISYKLHNENT